MEVTCDLIKEIVKEHQIKEYFLLVSRYAIYYNKWGKWWR